MIEYIKRLLKLATPLIIGNLGIVLIGFCDIFVAGRHSTDTLSAVSIGNAILMNLFIFGLSLLTAISPLLSNFRGENTSIKKYFIPTISFAMILACIITILAIATIPLVDMLGFEAKLIPDIKKYMFICAFSNFGVYLFVALKEFLQAYEIVVFPNILNIFCVVLNLYLNYVFVFGWYGLPQMRASGLALATTVSRIIVGLILLGFCLKKFNIIKYRDTSYFVKIIRMGLPISAAVLLEIVAFNAITIFAAQISGIYAAVQSILIAITNGSFMVPMAIGNAVAVKVGFENGAKNYPELKKYAYSGIIISECFMACCAIIFLLLPQNLIELFSKDMKLVGIAVPIVMLAGLFQLFDGLQVTIGGIFKGLKNTKVMMIGMFVAYWVIGLPIGTLLAFKFGLDLIGFWIGLTLSIASLGVGLLLAMKRAFKKMN